MSHLIEVVIPDIGDDGEVDVIEVLVNEGDRVEIEQSLITLESDKASMEVPSSHAGVVKELLVKVGDKVSEGSAIVKLEAEEDEVESADIEQPTEPASLGSVDETPAASSAQTVTVQVPDIGGEMDVDVIEVLVNVGESVEEEQSLITLESDKASMEVPSSHAGTIKEVLVSVGDKVSEGSDILILETSESVTSTHAEETTVTATSAEGAKEKPAAVTESDSSTIPTTSSIISSEGGKMASEPPSRVSPTEAYAATDVPATSLPHASPSVRAFARELGVDLNLVQGSGRKGRITPDDVRQYVKARLAEPVAASPAQGAQLGGLELLSWPKVDFSRFGEIQEQPLSRIRKISGANLHRNWVMIPHVTNNDVADITELEAFRKELNQEYKKEEVRITILAFIIKACVAALKRYPEFNSSLDGDKLILKKYYHIGFAADTPHGLMVPVIRDADKKGIIEIAQETAALAAAAREGKLSAEQMQGGTFTISSLGGIGGTDFTPIINAPEVAILGVSRSTMQPVWNQNEFIPRLMLPLSLSYDHRVIDGAAAARFNAYLSQLLADFRRIVL